jgi:type I restriction enzyme S subunit
VTTAAPLGSVLTKSDNWVEIDPLNNYTELTVHLWGRGVSARRVVEGSEIAGQRRLKVLTGEFVVSRIDARHGAFGIIPDDLNGAVVSNDFPAFRPNPECLLPEYLGWWSRTHDFVEACRTASEGTTNRVRLKEEKFAQIEIPLPPLAEQRRIAAKIERLAAKVDEARGLGSFASNETDALTRSRSRSVFRDLMHSKIVKLEQICVAIIDCLHANPVYSDEGIPTIRSPDVAWGRLLLETARRTGEEEYHRRTSRGEPLSGDIILVREGGGTGKAGIVEDGQRLSLGQRVMQLRPDRSQVLPRFLLHQWLSPLIQEDQIEERLKGSASPHLNIGDLRHFPFKVAPLEQQRRIVAYLDGLQAKVDRLKALQAQTRAELDALLPSILDRAFKGAL